MEKNQEFEQPFIKGIIDRIENNLAVIMLPNNQSILWPIDKLPEQAIVGSSVKVTLSSSTSETKNRQRLAKTILNEILKIS